MTRFYRSYGSTPSERILHQLCTGTFLSLWSYANVYRDQGRRDGAGVGKELCDLLVVFGNHVLIFSDKSCEFPNSGKLRRDWGRWYKRAVARSAKQVFGAERWLRDHPTRVFLDPECSVALPFAMPQDPQIHRIVVATGARRRHAQENGGNGSLILLPSIEDGQHVEGTSKPFTVGWVDRAKGYVHVFDDLTIIGVLRQLDTVTDFVSYLEQKERLVDAGGLAFAADELCLLAAYLTSIDEDGYHAFSADAVAGTTQLIIDPDAWTDLKAHPNYRNKLVADKPSHFWDRFIEHWTGLLEREELIGEHANDVYKTETALRAMAAERRVHRRALGQALLDVRSKVAPKGADFAARTVVTDKRDGEQVFAIVAVRNDADDYLEYREYRKALLEAHLHVTKSRFPQAQRIIGIAFDGGCSQGGSEDLLYFEPPDPWTAEHDARAHEIAEKLGLRRSPNLRHVRDYEFPPVLPVSTEERRRERNRQKRKRRARRRRK